jgi:putative flippase GtrA
VAPLAQAGDGDGGGIAGACPVARPRTLFVLSQHQISSVAATGVDFSVMGICVSLLGLSPVIGTVLGALSGALTSFTLGRQWVFDAAEGELFGQALRYALVSALSLAGNTLGEKVVTSYGIHYFLGRVAVSFIVGVAWNFPMHRYFVFRQPPPARVPVPATSPADASDDAARARTGRRQTSS